MSQQLDPWITKRLREIEAIFVSVASFIDGAAGSKDKREAGPYLNTGGKICAEGIRELQKLADRLES